jgi:hypothetical protein
VVSLGGRDGRRDPGRVADDAGSILVVVATALLGTVAILLWWKRADQAV